MKFYRDVIAHLLKNAFEGHTRFSVADDSAIGDNPIRSVSLDAVPVDDHTIISLAWDGGTKLFEKTLSDQEAKHQFDLISTDLAEVASLTKEGNYDAAKTLMKKLDQKYAENTGEIVDTNVPKLHTTQALKDLDANLLKQAKITMQNLWFSTPNELLEYQKKQKELAGSNEKNVPLWEQQKSKTPAVKDTDLAPASLSYEDAEKERAKEHEDIQQHIDEKIKTELESALQEKAASVFGPNQVELVEVLRKNGRNWDEIKKILTKDFGFDKDATTIFVDEQRKTLDPTDVTPINEKKEVPLTPPENLVSPETHEKLLHDHEDKKDKVLVKEPSFTPKEVMDIPEDKEIEKVESSLSNEIARADNDDIRKVASSQYYMKQEYKEQKEASLNKQALNPLQEPIKENLTTPNQDNIQFGKSKNHQPPEYGDRVFVSSDLTGEKAGFEASFVSAYKSKGTDYSIVETDDGDMLEVESHRVTKTSDAAGAQDTEPILPQSVTQSPEQEIQVTPKLEDLHSSQEVLLIKADLDRLTKIVKEADGDEEEIGYFGELWPALGGTFIKHDDHEDAKIGLVRDGIHAGSTLWECPRDSGNMRWDFGTKEASLNKQSESSVVMPMMYGIDDESIIQYANGSIYKNKIDAGQMTNADWEALIRDTARWMTQVNRDHISQTFSQDAEWKLDPEQINKLKTMFNVLPKASSLREASDFEKGISQNKTSDNKIMTHCNKCKKTFYDTPYETECPACRGVDKCAADPTEAPKTQFKDVKITPRFVPKEQAIPAGDELGAVLSKMDVLQQNLDTLEMAREQVAAKLHAELKKIDDEGQRAQMEAELQETIEKAAVLINAVDSKIVQWKDKLLTLQTEEINYVPKLSPKEMLAKIYQKFDGAEQYVKDVLNGMLSQAKRVTEKTLYRWPNKKGSLVKEASVFNELDQYNDELLAALRLLSSPIE